MAIYERNRSITASARRLAPSVVVLCVVALAAVPAPALAGLFHHGPQYPPQEPPFKAKPTPGKPVDPAVAAALIQQIRQALDERRYVDAGALLDQTMVLNMRSPELAVLSGELLLANGRYAQALAAFKPETADSGQKGRALQGAGISLSLLGRSDEALVELKAAVAADKTQWRAWNALGKEYDLRRDWVHAKAAYAAALAAPGANAATVLNNRGYSAMLQDLLVEAAADFVSALQKDPSLTAARTNLRITLAMEGAYDRAAQTGIGDDRAAVLNNVGLTAAMRGDYPEADRLLTQAIAAKGQFYARASENLQLTHDLASQKGSVSSGSNGPH